MDLSGYSVFGIKYEDLLKYIKKYKRARLLLYILDIVVVIVSTMLLFNTGRGFSDYINFFVLTTVLFSLCFSVTSNQDMLSCYSYIKHIKKGNISSTVYCASIYSLYALLYTTSKSKLTLDTEASDYIKCMNKVCLAKPKFRKSIISNLADNDANSIKDEVVKIKCTYIEKDDCKYFINLSLIEEGNE